MSSELPDFNRIIKLGKAGKITRAEGDRVIYAKIDGGDVITFTPKQALIRDKTGFRRYRGESLKDIGIMAGKPIRVQIREGSKHLEIDSVFLE